MEHLVLTVIAPDRPGLVEALADCVAAQGGNWLESRMAHLAGQFAGILSVEVEPELRNGLVETLQQLAIPGLRILVGEPGQPAPVGAPLVQLDLLGNDRVGIVLDNGPEMAAAFIAIGAGTTAAPLNPSYKADEFTFYLTDLNAKLLVVADGSESPAVAVAARSFKLSVSSTPLSLASNSVATSSISSYKSSSVRALLCSAS